MSGILMTSISVLSKFLPAITQIKL